MFRSIFGSAVLVALTAVLLADEAQLRSLQAQVVIGPGGGGFARWTNPMGQSLQWLAWPQIQKEIDLVPEQKEKIGKLQIDVQAKMAELGKVFQSTEGDQGEKMKKYQDGAVKLAEDTDKKVREILLPHQLKRIEQINLQIRMSQSHYGYNEGLFNDDLLKTLDITDAQKEEFKKRGEELRADMQKKTQEFYKKLADESREKLLGVLSASQRAKLDELIGPKFELQPYQWNPGGEKKEGEKKDK